MRSIKNAREHFILLLVARQISHVLWLEIDMELAEIQEKDNRL